MKTLDQHLADWDIEETLGDPRFSFKHAIRLQGLFLDDQNDIYDNKGKLYAKLKEVKWKDKGILEARVKLNNSEAYHNFTIEISKLK